MKILKFSAVWCPGCLVMRPIWKSIGEEYSNLDIIEYDYEMDFDAVEKYNVKDKLPVIIMVDENDKEIKRLVGEKTKEEILEFIRE